MVEINRPAKVGCKQRNRILALNLWFQIEPISSTSQLFFLKKKLSFMRNIPANEVQRFKSSKH